MDAWEFLLAGGAIYDNLDYTFIVGAEDGSGKNRAPGCCERALHKQLAVLGRFSAWPPPPRPSARSCPRTSA